jgi:hypothetical protein
MEIVSSAVMAAPALIIGEKIVVKGRVPFADDMIPLQELNFTPICITLKYKKMNKILLIAIFLVVPVLTAMAQDSNDLKGVEAYYFHNTRRCMTCNTVEKVTKESLKELYGDRIILKSLVFEDQKNKALVDKYKVEGQSLFFVKGDKKVDITTDAFMNAVRRPEVVKEKIRTTVASLK